ncbi:MAG: hypothetical protein ACRC61_12460 [Aeromonas salmonicida]
MPRVEQMLVRYLSPETVASLEAPRLPSRPIRATLTLQGKAYKAAGQAAACMHTMAVLQAYRADLLGDLDGGSVVDLEAVSVFPWATDLTLRATMETERAAGRSVDSVMDRFQEVTRQMAAFKRYLPRHSRALAAASGRKAELTTVILANLEGSGCRGYTPSGGQTAHTSRGGVARNHTDVPEESSN